MLVIILFIFWRLLIFIATISKPLFYAQLISFYAFAEPFVKVYLNGRIFPTLKLWIIAPFFILLLFDELSFILLLALLLASVGVVINVFVLIIVVFFLLELQILIDKVRFSNFPILQLIFVFFPLPVLIFRKFYF